MTANQISYAKYLEDVRTHKVQEAETERSNRQREYEQNRGNTLNYQAQIYSTQAAMRNADVAAATSREVAAINSATQLQVATVNADTARRGQDITAATNKRAQDLNYLNEAERIVIERNSLGEKNRSNVTNERLNAVSTVLNGIANVAKVAGGAMTVASFLA